MHEKMNKNFIQGDIRVVVVAYTLKVSTNKRQPIYINGVYENTIPYYYKDIEK